jgi:CheY-like chemotaxis protein
MPAFDVSKPLHERGRVVIDFHDLMRIRVMDILLVASPYDTFLLEEAGQLAERQAGEFRSLDVHYEPGLTGVTRGSRALELLGGERRYDLVVSTVRVSDMDVVELARRVKQVRPDVPVILLAFDAQEMKDFVAGRDVSDLERVFLWQGDARILQAIVKYVEDRRNVRHDTRVAGVQAILLVEDNVRRYSSFLPVLYAELLRQSRRLISEGLNVPQTIARMRARPKVLLCTTFEEAWEAFESYTDEILGVISDIDFPRGGRNDPEAGFELARRVRAACPDVPVILHSSHKENAARARQLGADFLRKGSPLLLQRLREVLGAYFGFGDFVFRCRPDGPEVARAGDLRSLEQRLGEVPAESVAYHAERNHFSKWLKARTEFGVADALRPRRVCDYPDVEALRRDLIDSIAAYRAERSALSVADFDRDTFDAAVGFHRIGGGSLGGKARGLAFARRLLAEARVSRGYPGVLVDVPPCVVLATDVFERFLDENDLRDFAVHCDDDAEIERRFLEARFPDSVRLDLAAFLAVVRHPLAVRSSSLLEDSHYQPFTGVYATYMLPNLHPLLEVRLRHLLQAVQRVYASTFSSHTKAYLQATPYRLEEEKMAVILQRLVGSERGGRFYPDFAGVARSHNFYPTPPIEAEDGVVAVALGLGRTVVEGGNCLRFSPRHPRHLMSFSSVDDVLRNSQREFWALALREAGGASGLTPMSETRFDLGAAEADGALALLGSTYSHDNHAVYDGLSRAGLRVVTFAPILKHAAFPLPEIVRTLLDLAQEGVAAPVEIEFAVDLARREFGFLQVRPLTAAHDEADVDLGDVPAGRLVCHSTRVLGHGRVEGVHDAVVVDAGRFERGRSREVAQDLAQLNARLVQSGVAYLLIGVGRWGSRDPWLGIPVTWDQISGARAIVEAGFRDLRVAPSQGSHFFQNITSFNVAYFTVNPDLGEGFVDWDWLRAQPAVHESGALRHLRFDEPIVVRMNGPRHEGVILKPGS